MIVGLFNVLLSGADRGFRSGQLSIVFGLIKLVLSESSAMVIGHRDLNMVKSVVIFLNFQILFVTLGPGGKIVPSIASPPCIHACVLYHVNICLFCFLTSIGYC